MTQQQLEKAIQLKEEIKDLQAIEANYGNVRHDAVVVLFKDSDPREAAPMPMPEHIWEQLLAYNEAEIRRKASEFGEL